MKTRMKYPKLILAASYLAIWLFSMVAFWCLISGADAMAYALLFIWGLHPIAMFVFSLLIGIKNYWGKQRWIAPILFGVMYMLAPYLTFSLANTIAAGNIHIPEFRMILLGAVISVVGLTLGGLIRFLNTKRKDKPPKVS